MRFRPYAQLTNNPANQTNLFQPPRDATRQSHKQTRSGLLSPGGATTGSGGDLSCVRAGAAGLANRRRSSIAVIPQMQICPGDLLVYSKQLIDRMYHDDGAQEPPDFLTISDKKSKNIWSSFKLVSVWRGACRVCCSRSRN